MMSVIYFLNRNLSAHLIIITSLVRPRTWNCRVNWFFVTICSNYSLAACFKSKCKIILNVRLRWQHVGYGVFCTPCIRRQAIGNLRQRAIEIFGYGMFKNTSYLVTGRKLALLIS
jgi:hypothetical protein